MLTYKLTSVKRDIRLRWLRIRIGFRRRITYSLARIITNRGEIFPVVQNIGFFLELNNHRDSFARLYRQFAISEEVLRYMDLNDRKGFERFLRKEKGFEKKAIPWMVRWVRGFLSGLDSPARWDQRCREYYAELENRVAGWQYAQAAKSVQLYLEFYHRSDSSAPAARVGSWEEVEETARREMRRQGKALQTEKTYMYWIGRFRIHGTTPLPDKCSIQDVKDFLTHLAVEKRVSVATQNQAFNALLFLYRFVIGRSIADLQAIPRSRPSKRLPVVLSADQISAIIGKMKPPYALMAALMYGSGIRLNECLSLRHKDIDIEHQVLTVRQGKGDTDRYSVMRICTWKR